MVSVKNHLVRTAAVGALGVAALAGFVAPASAAQRAPGASHLITVATAAKPNTNIEGSPAKWVPTKLTAPPVKSCTKTSYSFTITNKTKKAETVQVKSGTTKKTLGTLKVGEKAGVCASGAKGAKGMFYIKGASSVLTVTLS